MRPLCLMRPESGSCPVGPIAFAVAGSNRPIGCSQKVQMEVGRSNRCSRLPLICPSRRSRAASESPIGAEDHAT
jgi:hypothetical protein